MLNRPLSVLVATLAWVSLASWSAQAAVIGDFESGLDSWTVSGNWERDNNGGPNQFIGGTSNINGSFWVDSWVEETGSGGDGNTGTITSPDFTLTDLLTFRLSGHGGNGNGSGNFGVANSQIADMGNQWRLYRASNDELLAQGTAPFDNEGNFRNVLVDTTDHIGVSAYLVLEDAATNGFGWFAADYFQTEGTRNATSIFTLEIGDDQGDWTLPGGGSFDYYTVLNNPSNSSGRMAREGGEFLRSDDGGTGTATSPTFTITRDTIEFYTAGFGEVDPNNSDNRVELRLASDNSVLMTWGDNETLGGDNWTAQTGDVSLWANQVVYLALVDAVNGGFGWVGIDDVRLTGDFTVIPVIPEPAAMAIMMLGAAMIAGRRRTA